MCNADLSPAVWQYDNEAQRMQVRRDTVHTCRAYDELESEDNGYNTPSEFGSDNFNQSWGYQRIPSHDQLVAAGLVLDKNNIVKNQVLQ